MSNIPQVVELRTAINQARHEGMSYEQIRQMVDFVFVSEPGSLDAVAARMGVNRLTVMAKRHKFGIRSGVRRNKERCAA